MTNHEIQDILSKITYKPGWKVEFCSGDKITFPVALEKGFGSTEARDRPYLQVSVDETAEASMDSLTRSRSRWKGAKVYLSPHMCRQEIVGAAFGAIQAAELHEMREWFRYGGVSIYNPHLDPDFLLEAINEARSQGRRILSIREDAMSMGEKEPPAGNPDLPPVPLRPPRDGERVIWGDLFPMEEDGGFILSFPEAPRFGLGWTPRTGYATVARVHGLGGRESWRFCAWAR